MNGKKVKINVEYLRPNSRIIYPLYNSEGKKIAEARDVLTADRIASIRSDCGSIVFAVDTGREGAVSLKKMNAARMVSRDIVHEITATEKLTRTAYLEAERVIEEIVADLQSYEFEAINLLKDLKSHEEYIYQHSVNVGILAAVFARVNGDFTPDEIKRITLGAYLLDIGLVKIDVALLKKKGRFEAKDMQKMKQHPQFGYEILKNIPGIDPIVLQTVLFHHEKNSYKGYFQLPYDLLPMPPKIVSVCDVYDALTTDRPYRQALSPTDALRFLVNSIGTNFDYILVHGFINHVGPLLNNTQSFYRRGDFCELNTRELAMIMEFSMLDYLKPRVLVFCKFQRVKNKMIVKFYDRPVEVSLEDDEDRRLVKIIDNPQHIHAIRTRLIEKGMIVWPFPSASG